LCIILYKPKNVKLPNLEILDNCFYNNPDGTGFMYQHNNKVIINKGFMNFNSFVNAINQLQDIINLNLVIHFRLASHGKVTKGNCHPFPISKNITRLTKTTTTTNQAIVHNGIISFCSDPLRKYSDTQIFIKNHLSKLDVTNPAIQNLIQESTNSKYIIMTRDNIYLLGNFIEKNGVYYSNNSYNYYYDDYHYYTEFNN